MKSGLQHELQRIPHGQRRAYLKRAAQARGVSPATLYRELIALRGKQRATAKREPDVPDAVIAAIAALKAKSLRFGTTPRELSTERCIAMLERSGAIPPGVSASTVNRRLKEARFRDAAPVIRYEADHVNQSHQLDFSRSKYFELLEYDASRDDYVLIVNARSYVTKKDDGKKLRLWLAQLVDEKSRSSLKMYFPAAGENTLMGLEFLQFCWGRDEDAHPFRYLPEYIRSDNGSFMKSEEAQRLLDALSIQWLPITPGNSGSLGKNERRWRSLWQGWELEMAVRLGSKGTIYLAELNELIHAEMVRELDNKHPRIKNTTIGHVYRAGIQKHPPRTADLDTMRLACRVLTRMVKPDCTLTIDNVELTAPEQYRGQRIRVFRNAEGSYVGEAIDDKSQRFELQPFKAQGFLQYKRFPETAQEAAAKRYDASDLPERLRTIPTAAPASGNVKYLKPKPQEIEPDTPFEAAPLRSFADADKARSHIGRALRCPYTEVADIFEPVLQQTLDIDLIDGVIQSVRTAAVNF